MAMPQELTRVRRYDMLCVEGISLMLNIFRGRATSPEYRTLTPSNGKAEVLTAHKEVCSQGLLGRSII